MKLPLWKLTTARRKLFELFGSSKYSHTAYEGVERVLLKRLPSTGFFIEAGAVDGVFESNTYFLEKFRGWSGVLIEPVPEMYCRLRINRPNATTFNCALVASEAETPTVTINNNHAMSSVIEENVDTKRDSNSYIEIQGRTLTSILHETGISNIDLLSLDVEGHELEVLKGLDFNLYRPVYILCECLTEKDELEIQAYLANDYNMIEKVTYRDLLFESKQ